MGHKEPLAAGLGCLAKTVEHIAEKIIPLRSVLPSKRQIRCHNDPPLIRNLARIPDRTLCPSFHRRRHGLRFNLERSELI